ncbi:hypothetical protein [Marinomonas spartinae]|uniref:hypothetical protein n=1 Tax=Marinomonas spartinae TaxID=1792290 RepID=UPI0018F20B61|nr:hypothetical protein [Marinomonas spartinae]MBJ7555409.1 hypothetical protein [Marinomonas spartinae]
MELTNKIKKIEDLIKEDSEDALIYAVLECRMAIEIVSKKKIDFYCKRYNTKLLNKHWQPNKAIKLLKQIEPQADQSYELMISREGQDTEEKNWISLGKHESLSLKSTTDYFHKLGSYLHYRNDTDLNKLKKLLNSALSDLTRVNQSTLMSDLALTIAFECKKCSTPIHYNEEGTKNIHEFVCPNPSCEAVYKKKPGGDGTQLIIDNVMFTCQQCEQKEYINSSKVDIGYIFTCSSCKAQHEVIEKQWMYGLCNL